MYYPDNKTCQNKAINSMCFIFAYKCTLRWSIFYVHTKLGIKYCFTQYICFLNIKPFNYIRLIIIVNIKAYFFV